MGEVHANAVVMLVVLIYLFGSAATVYVFDLDERETFAYLGVTMYVFILGTYLLS